MAEKREHFLRRGLVAVVMHDDLGAYLIQKTAHCSPDATGPTGYQGNLTAQSVRHETKISLGDYHTHLKNGRCAA